MKRSILTEAQGIPIAIAVDAANVHDNQLLEETLNQIRIPRPDPYQIEQHLCLDKGYTGEEHRDTVLEYGYHPHIPQKENAKVKLTRQKGRRKPRRWVVERAASWINRFRRILIRWEKKIGNYEAMLSLACASQILAKLKVRIGS